MGHVYIYIYVFGNLPGARLRYPPPLVAVREPWSEAAERSAAMNGQQISLLVGKEPNSPLGFKVRVHERFAERWARLGYLGPVSRSGVQLSAGGGDACVVCRRR